ncbi:hypothetical protein FC87_GL000735 [Fructilactobacillus florum DSM 22689 = JCM 16035]|uniref:Cyanophage baseplate Pam3 plug gp18 domain-containing protein n=2 Tax=Fructilactobacillus florum TaxID=640331 RepID=A0A0R2CVI2_9LACO|nr:hypothetical protein FC87_GL000735 [Fructilactobacillus florum DSM 22689 = JCM 16035]
MPYYQTIKLDDGNYNLRFNWNEIGRFYTVDLFDAKNNLIYAGERLQLNQRLWRGIWNEKFPMETLIPIDDSGKETEINPANLNVTVFLCVDDGSDGSDSN